MSYSDPIPYERPSLRQPGSVIAGLFLLFIGLTQMVLTSVIASENNAISTAIYLTIVIVVASVLGRKDRNAALLILVFVLSWQPLLSMPIANIVGSMGVKSLVATKDIYITVLLATLFWRNGKEMRWQYIDIIAVIFVAVYFFYFISSPSNLFGRLVSFREGFMIAAYYLAGRLLLFKQEDIKWLLRVIVIVSTSVVIFGYIERFLFSPELWHEIGAIDYTGAKRAVSTRIGGDVPDQWYTYIHGAPVRRMVSSIGDPTALGRFLSLPLLALIFLKKPINYSKKKLFSNKLFILLMFAGAVILTLCRGGLLIALGGIFIWTLFAHKTKWQLVISVFLMIAVIFFVITSPILDPQSGSPVRHMTGFSKGVEALYKTPFGNGLGTSGQMALYYSQDIEEKAGESYFVSLAYQTGIAGIIAYFLFAGAILRNIVRIYRKNKALEIDRDGANMALLGLSVAAGIFATSLLSNAAISPLSAGLSLLYCGTVVGLKNKENI